MVCVELSGTVSDPRASSVACKDVSPSALIVMAGRRSSQGEGPSSIAEVSAVAQSAQSGGNASGYYKLEILCVKPMPGIQIHEVK